MCSNIRNIFIKCLQIEDDDDEDTDSINDNDSRSLEAQTDENEPNNSKNSKISETDIKKINSAEGGVNPEIIDQVVAEMDDIAQMKMVQELAKVQCVQQFWWGSEIWSFWVIVRIIIGQKTEIRPSSSFYRTTLKISIFWPKIILKISKNDQIEVAGPKFFNAL